MKRVGECHRSRSVTVAVALAVLGLATAGHAQEKTLPIGVLGPLSGGAASYGIDLVRGAELRADEINRAGGLRIGGDTYRLKLISYDHKASAAEATTVTNKLVFQDKVKYIVGNAIGATCNAAQTITEPNKVFFSFMCWGNILGPDKPYSFRAIHSQWEVPEPFYQWVKEKHPGIKKIATISPNDLSGRDTSAGVVKAAKALGLEIVADEYYERGTKDFYPVLTKILAKKPDMIDLSASAGGEAGLILKQLRELGFTGAKGWTAGANPFTAIEIAGKEAVEGLWSPLNINVKGPTASPAIRQFGQDFEKRYGEVPGVTALANYAALDVVTKAMQHAGSIETEKVVAALTQRRYETVWGPLVVGGKEQYGTDRQFLYPVTITEIRDGALVDLAQTLPPALRTRR